MAYITENLPTLYHTIEPFGYLDGYDDNDIIAEALRAPLDVVYWLLGFDDETSDTERAIIDMIDHLLEVAGI